MHPLQKKKKEKQQKYQSKDKTVRDIMVWALLNAQRVKTHGGKVTSVL